LISAGGGSYYEAAFNTRQEARDGRVSKLLKKGR
jgi:hypothetical protein